MRDEYLWQFLKAQRREPRLIGCVGRSGVWSRCWLWPNRLNGGGYGELQINGAWAQIHRLVAVIRLGLDADNPQEFACHHCDIRHCYNEDHLYIGNARSNAQDAVNRRRFASGSRAYRNIGKDKAQEVVAAFGRGESGASIARRLKIGQTTAYNIITGTTWKYENLGLRKRNQKRALTDVQVLAVRQFAAAGEMPTRIARRLGLPREPVLDAVRGRQYQDVDGPITPRPPARKIIRKGRRRGIDRPNAVLTDELVRHIRALALLGKTSYAIGRELSLNRRTVYDVMKGRYWKHVT